MAKEQAPPDEQVAGQEAVHVDEVTGELVQDEDGPREGDMGLAEYLQTERADSVDEAETAYRQIILQILSAETVDDILTPVEAVGLRDCVDQVMEIFGFHENRSDFEVGSPMYLSIECVLESTGEKTIVNTGNQAVMAQLIGLRLKNAFPIKVRVVERGRTNKWGNRPLRLVKP